MSRKVISGYVFCACRDCMELAITSHGEPVLCHECNTSGCIAGAEQECQAPGAYGGDEIESKSPIADAIATILTGEPTHVS
jgi:hypothetical protein